MAGGTLTRFRLRLFLLAAFAGAIVVVLLALRGGDPAPALLPGAKQPRGGDPLAWSPERSDDFARRAAAGLSHVLYVKSPGGLVASAQRTASWRPLIEQVAKATREDPDTLESIVLLESAGRAEAVAGNSLEGAVGLTQILAETGRNLLGMRVDVDASQKLTRRIARADGRGQAKRAQKLRAQRRRVDERFDPRKALAATAHYLAFARGKLHRDDLAIASYHMGVGNLRQALSLYGAPNGIPYAQLFFDSTPQRHEASQRFLARLGDDSSTYLWRVNAAREALHLLRSDRDELERRQELQTRRNSAEVLLHPPDKTETFEDPGALGDAYDDGEIVPLPVPYLHAHGIAIDRGMGSVAASIGEQPDRYRGLRREALATLAYIGRQVRQIANTRSRLILTSTVRDEKYQRALASTDIEATDNYSLHTTGYAFDVARNYASRAQALAFQFVLDRLTALDLVAWVREPHAIHVTVAHDAERLEAPLGVRGG
jgi:hypothetical protein